MSRLLIDGAAVVTCDATDRFLAFGQVLIEGSQIAFVGEAGGAKPAYDKRIDASGCIVIPGLVNTHTHLLIGLLRGFSDDLPLFPWLEALGPRVGMMTADDFRTGIELGVSESLRSGTTCLCECGRYEVGIMADVANAAGLRVVTAGLPMSQMFGEPVPADYTRLVANLQDTMARWGQGTGLVTAALGAHSTYNCSPDFLREGKRLARALGLDFYVHLAECQAEVSYIRERFGKTPVQYLADLDVLDERTVGIHSVWLTDDDIGVMAQSGARVAHCPTSNAKLASGIARVPEYRRAGIPVGLGTDSVVSNNRLSIFLEMSMAVLIQRATRLDAACLIAVDALRMATIEGARVMGLDARIGSIEVGKLADLVVLRATSPQALTRELAVSDVVYATHRDDIRWVLVDGRVVVDHGRLTNLQHK